MGPRDARRTREFVKSHVVYESCRGWYRWWDSSSDDVKFTRRIYLSEKSHRSDDFIEWRRETLKFSQTFGRSANGFRFPFSDFSDEFGIFDLFQVVCIGFFICSLLPCGEAENPMFYKTIQQSKAVTFSSQLIGSETICAKSKREAHLFFKHFRK